MKLFCTSLKIIMNKIFAIILTFAAASVFGGKNTQIKTKYGAINPYFNQTSFGTFRRVSGENEDFRLQSVWMQDDVNKRVRMDLGKRGQPGFIMELYFFKDSAYEASSGKCIKFPDFNYSMEISTYGYPNFGLLGRHTLHEFDDVKADVYIGQAVDGVGPLNCLFYCDSETCTKFLGLTIVGQANKYSFVEYWFGNNLTTEIPPAEWFDLPAECENPEIEYYFEKYNSDATLKQTTKKSDFCTNNMSKEVSMVLYRSLCCGLEHQLGGSSTSGQSEGHTEL